MVLPVTVMQSPWRKPAVEQRLDQHRHAADLIHVLGDVAFARLQIGDIGRLAEDVADVMQIELDARLMGDGRQMQAAIGRAARRRDHHGRILQRLRVTMSRGRMFLWSSAITAWPEASA